MGASRLVAKTFESITNPKDDKHKSKQKKQQQQQQEQEEEEEQEQQAAEQQLADALTAETLVQQADAAADAAADASIPEATAAAGTAQQAHSIVSEYTEELIEEAPKTMQQRYADATQFLSTTPTGKGISIAAGLFLGATFMIALYRTWQKYSSPRAQRMRVIDKNKLLVAELSKYLPDKRSELTTGVIRKLRGQTGFTPVEVFRKYLWFLLRERQFDIKAVEDMVLLKTVLGLTDDEVAEALKERSQRIYDKYGTLMLNTEGMTPEGIERKATCRALFGKLLYLTEHEPLVAAGSEAFKVTDLRMTFGATDEDVDKLRIVSLYDIDLDKMDAMMRADTGAAAAGAAADEAAAGGSSSPQQHPEGDADKKEQK